MRFSRQKCMLCGQKLIKETGVLYCPQQASNSPYPSVSHYSRIKKENRIQIILPHFILDYDIKYKTTEIYTHSGTYNHTDNEIEKFIVKTLFLTLDFSNITKVEEKLKLLTLFS